MSRQIASALSFRWRCARRLNRAHPRRPPRAIPTRARSTSQAANGWGDESVFGLCDDLPAFVNSTCVGWNTHEACDASHSPATCGCIFVSDLGAVDRIRHWQHGQAAAQLVFALISLVLGVLFVAATLFLWPDKMYRYPQTLAIWMYACDLSKSLSLALVAAVRLGYVGAPLAPWVITSRVDCLCHADPAQPGCFCAGGVLAWMLQAGLVGSVAFYCALAHNFYSSVADPFTRPQSRQLKYCICCATALILLSVPYLLPAGHGRQFSGHGYRADYLACWFPTRYTDWLNVGPLTLSNPQARPAATDRTTDDCA